MKKEKLYSGSEVTIDAEYNIAGEQTSGYFLFIIRQNILTVL